MEPLRDVFAGLAGNGGDPGDFLRDLPADLVAEAVVSYADTAPLEVAEHLAPFVSARFDADDAGETWLDLLASAPAETEASGLDDQDLGFGTGSGTAVDDLTRFDVPDDGIGTEFEEPPAPESGHEVHGLDGDGLGEDWAEFGDDDPDDGDDGDPLA
jgi:hypothetical protein